MNISNKLTGLLLCYLFSTGLTGSAVARTFEQDNDIQSQKTKPQSTKLQNTKFQSTKPQNTKLRGTNKKPAQAYFTDVELVNQSGETQRLYGDLLKDKVVIIHSFFSTCKSGCPVAMQLMAGIQERFHKQMGEQLHILSISLDPVTDTPLKLSAYAKELNVGPGWQLISGDKKNIDFALKKFGHYVADIEAHKNTIIIGNERTGLWKKAFLLAKREALDNIISSVLQDTIPVNAAAH